MRILYVGIVEKPAFAEAVRRTLEMPTPSSTDRAAEIEFERHRWLYDRLSLGNALRKAGFVDVCSRTAVESAMPEFRSFALDADLEGRVRKPDSLFMEAKRDREMSGVRDNSEFRYSFESVGSASEFRRQDS